MTAKKMFVIQSPSKVIKIKEILAEIKPDTEWSVIAVLSPVTREKYEKNLLALKKEFETGNYDQIIIATDPDSEGERVARDIYNFTGFDASCFKRIHMIMITKNHLNEIIDNEPEHSIVPFLTMQKAYAFLEDFKQEEYAYLEGSKQEDLGFSGITYLDDNTVKITLLTVTQDKQSNKKYKAEVVEGGLYENLANKVYYESDSIDELKTMLPNDVLSVSYEVTTLDDFNAVLEEVSENNLTPTIKAVQYFLRCIHGIHKLKNKEKVIETVKSMASYRNGMIGMLQKEGA